MGKQLVMDDNCWYRRYYKHNCKQFNWGKTRENKVREVHRAWFSNSFTDLAPGGKMHFILFNMFAYSFYLGLIRGYKHMYLYMLVWVDSIGDIHVFLGIFLFSLCVYVGLHRMDCIQPTPGCGSQKVGNLKVKYFPTNFSLGIKWIFFLWNIFPLRYIDISWEIIFAPYSGWWNLLLRLCMVLHNTKKKDSAKFYTEQKFEPYGLNVTLNVGFNVTFQLYDSMTLRTNLPKYHRCKPLIWSLLLCSCHIVQMWYTEGF